MDRNRRVLELHIAVLDSRKKDLPPEHKYADVFSDSAFYWESQNRNTQKSPVIRRLISLDAPVLLPRSGARRGFDINLVLQRLLEEGKVLVKRAYGDWTRYRKNRKALHGAAVELIEVPQRRLGGKNSADIRLVVDALDLCYSKEHVDTFAIVSGDSDFSPLVSKLRENGKYVIGVGVRNSTSELLMENCDEFVFYEDLLRLKGLHLSARGIPKEKVELFELLMSVIQALGRDARDKIWASMVKQTVKRKSPSFDESHYGYATFSLLLEDLAAHNLIQLKRDDRSRSYLITDYTSK